MSQQWEQDTKVVAGDYLIMINRSTSWLESGGAGTYRLIIGNPEGYTAPFTCTGYSDAGIGTDAGSDLSNPMVSLVQTQHRMAKDV